MMRWLSGRDRRVAFLLLLGRDEEPSHNIRPTTKRETMALIAGLVMAGN